MRKTKIICTLGPATESPETMEALIRAGADIFRLNMSHAKHDWVRRIVAQTRKISRAVGRPVGILLDTQGPAIRTGEVENKLDLKPGDIFEFTVRGAVSEEVNSVDVNYDGLIEDIDVGDVVLVDNGVMHMKVLSKKENRIRCEVLTAGVLGSKRHINLPGVKVNLPPLTAKDLADVALGAELGVDFVALSFCREASDIAELRKVLDSHGCKAKIVAKLEDQHAVKVMEEILYACDAVMVARGDLGIECPMEELPIIQRRIIKAAIRIGRPVVVATHMLESMIENPIPTRAEITDVANAVFEQADAIMLSGETTVGKYPVQCVQTFDRVACRIERAGGAGYAKDAEITTDQQKTVKSAILLADSLWKAKLVVFTRRGLMAEAVANLRPGRAQIFAFTPDEEVMRKLTIHRAIHPIQMSFGLRAEQTVNEAEQYLKAAGLVSAGEKLVFVSDIVIGSDRFDSIQVRRVV